MELISHAPFHLIFGRLLVTERQGITVFIVYKTHRPGSKKHKPPALEATGADRRIHHGLVSLHAVGVHGVYDVLPAAHALLDADRLLAHGGDDNDAPVVRHAGMLVARCAARLEPLVRLLGFFMRTARLTMPVPVRSRRRHGVVKIRGVG